VSAPRLLYVANAFSVGGVETLALELFRRLHPGRFHVEALLLKEPGTLAGELSAAGIATRSRILRGTYDPLGPVRLVGALAGRRFDLLLVEPGRNALLLAAVARRLVRARAVASWVHATGKWGKPSQFNETERRFLRRLDAVVAISETQRDHLVRDEGLDPANLVVIHNGVDTERFRPRPERRAEARAALGLETGDFAVGIVASLTPEKGHALLVEAAARLHMGGLPIRLLIAGEGPERAGIEAAIGAAGLSECATLLGLRRDLERDLYPALDLLALVSRPVRETLPISLMEGMACEVPIVATRVGSVTDLVEDGETGFLVAPGDPAALAGSIHALYLHPLRREAYGRAGRERILERFSIDRMVAEYASLFERLLAAARP
jgi:glycosyltransferase involved in cell wall biosynthesis